MKGDQRILIRKLPQRAKLEKKKTMKRFNKIQVKPEEKKMMKEKKSIEASDPYL